MTRREIMARVAGLVATLLPLAPAQVRAKPAVSPPDAVATVFVTDTVPGFGAAGGVVTDAPARARLELVAPGS